jgi:hypothetical protein
MPVEKKLATPAQALIELSEDAVAFIGFRQCDNSGCDHLHAKFTKHPELPTRKFGDEIHYAAWRTLNEDLPAPDALISVSIAYLDGLLDESGGASNAIVSVTGDTARLGPEGVIEGLEILIDRLRKQHGLQPEHPDANGAYL